MKSGLLGLKSLYFGSCFIASSCSTALCSGLLLTAQQTIEEIGQYSFTICCFRFTLGYKKWEMVIKTKNIVLKFSECQK